MRASLKHSLADSPGGGGESFRYPKGSIVLCNSCTVPVAVLEQGIALGDRAGRMANAMKPLTAADLDQLASREDIDPGVLAWVRHLTPEDRQTYLHSLHDFRTGDPMVCPVCDQCFVQVLAVERHEVLDRAYVVELLTIPPQGQKGTPIRGKRLGYYKDWVHESARGLA